MRTSSSPAASNSAIHPSSSFGMHYPCLRRASLTLSANAPCDRELLWQSSLRALSLLEAVEHTNDEKASHGRSTSVALKKAFHRSRHSLSWPASVPRPGRGALPCLPGRKCPPEHAPYQVQPGPMQPVSNAIWLGFWTQVTL